MLRKELSQGQKGACLHKENLVSLVLAGIRIPERSNVTPDAAKARWLGLATPSLNGGYTRVLRL